VCCGSADVARTTSPPPHPIFYRTARSAFANPNAPTGVAISRAEIAQLLEDHPDTLVLIDEAYVDFGGESAVPLIAVHPNLLIVQTMSKSRALAGLRVGYALGDAELIKALLRVKDSFNSYPLGRIAQAGATASVRDEVCFRESCARVIAGREADHAFAGSDEDLAEFVSLRSRFMCS
jgi:histidinol-phosphate aminotransferase